MTTATGRSADRRVHRTRRLLGEALVSLLQERSWDDFGVQDICERADVGRSTFYTHYQGKEQLLAGAFDDLSVELRKQADAKNKAKSERLSFVRGLIEHVGEQRRVFLAVIGRKSGNVVQVRFRKMLLNLVADDIARFSVAGWQREAGARYLAGALFELLAWWVEAPNNAVPSDEIERYFRRLSLPILAQIGRPAESGADLSSPPREFA